MSERERQATGTAVTQHDRALVWERVVAERGRGDAWREIAERNGLCERQCRRIYRSYMRSQPVLDHGDLLEEITQAASEYDSAIEELAILSATTTSDCAKVAAIRARINARSRKMELLRVAGVVGDVGDVRHEVDVRAISRAVINAFDEHDVPLQAREAVLDALRPDGH